MTPQEQRDLEYRYMERGQELLETRAELRQALEEIARLRRQIELQRAALDGVYV